MGHGDTGEQVTSAPWPGNVVRPPVDRRALVLPGRVYSVDLPLLFWSCQVLAAAGWFVQTVRWTAGPAADADPAGYVEAAAELAEREAPPADRTVVVAKSYGTLATRWADGRGYPGIWLTPMMHTPDVARPLATFRPPGLVVAGTEDSLWNPAARLAPGLRVLLVDGADHALQVGTDWRASLAALGEALEGVDAFLRGLPA